VSIGAGPGVVNSTLVPTIAARAAHRPGRRTRHPPPRQATRPLGRQLGRVVYVRQRLQGDQRAQRHDPEPDEVLASFSRRKTSWLRISDAIACIAAGSGSTGRGSEGLDMLGCCGHDVAAFERKSRAGHALAVLAAPL
jgi:hypothetical protein